jgi:hypothetical protein
VEDGVWQQARRYRCKVWAGTPEPISLPALDDAVALQVSVAEPAEEVEDYPLAATALCRASLRWFTRTPRGARAVASTR